MTEPSASTSPAPRPVAPAPQPPPSPLEFPLRWLLDHASGAIQYRAIVDVAKLSPDDNTKTAALTLSFRPALLLALLQAANGTWNGAMLSIPHQRSDHFEGIGTISAVRRLLEYGWDRDTPPVLHARRMLFRLLAEDDDPAFLFEFGVKGKPDEELTRRGRAILREAAAATLAQAGYEGDPRLRGAAHRILDRIADYLASPLAQKPWIRAGNKQVLAPEAAPPSVYALLMLAHMPHFRSEHHVALDRIYHHLIQPLPRQDSQQLIGTRLISQPHLMLGDALPHRNAADADVPFSLFWLELMARLGFLRRNDNWTKLFERFLDDRDRDGVWHPHKGTAAPRSSHAVVWPMFPLEDHAAGDERWTDVTFRLGLIARLSGRQIDLI